MKISFRYLPSCILVLLGFVLFGAGIDLNAATIGWTGAGLILIGAVSFILTVSKDI